MLEWLFFAALAAFSFAFALSGETIIEGAFRLVAIASGIFWIWLAIIFAMPNTEDDPLDTSSCTEFSKIWSWANCDTNEIRCRTHFLAPNPCAQVGPSFSDEDVSRMLSE